MGKVEYTTTFAHKGEEIKRLERKNDKHRLASRLVDIYHAVCDEKLSDDEKLIKVKSIAAASYW